MNTDKKIGRIEKGFFLQQFVGTVETQSKTMELCTAMNGAPMVSYNNKHYILEWQDIVKLAIDAGLLNEDTEVDNAETKNI